MISITKLLVTLALCLALAKGDCSSDCYDAYGACLAGAEVGNEWGTCVECSTAKANCLLECEIEVSSLFKRCLTH
jgi:hypothetical protein